MPSTTVIMPVALEQFASTGLVHLHEPSDFWLFAQEEVLTGRRIVFDKWSPESFEWDGIELWILNEPSVLAVFEGDRE